MSTELKVGLHQGKVMARLAANYNKLWMVVLEVVQNSIDSGATRIQIDLNLKQRRFVVFDNGSGAGKGKVAEALATIGSSIKTKGKYGQFGIGLISPIAVAKEFTFTSCPQPRYDEYASYHFVTSRITKQSEVSIPSSEVPNLHFDPQGETWWRTRVECTRISKDRHISCVEPHELAKEIALKFGVKIRSSTILIELDFTGEDGKCVTLQVEAPEFSGKKLPTYTDDKSNECGDVDMILFVSQLKKGGRKGQIVFGTMTNPSQITARQFVLCAGDMLKSEVAKVLVSGVLEGTILCQRVELHPDRTRFENNDALFNLCEVLERWYKKIGHQVVEEAEEVTSNDRFQRLGISVMPFAEHLLKQSQFTTVSQRITVGTIGTGHTSVPKNKIIGVDDAHAIARGGNPFEDRKKHGGSNGDGGRKPTKDRPGHKPGIVYGSDKGRVRTEVKGSSTGFRFEYVELDDFRIPFLFDIETGTLSFNLLNPNWAQCQETDKFLQRYHMAVLTAALTNELHRDGNGNLSPDIIQYSYDLLTNQVFGIRNESLV
jgi:hypothetical protein